MTGVLFEITFWLAAPFWALMILFPGWRGTRAAVASPWITVLPLAVYLMLALPHFGELWAAVSRPDLEVLRAFLGQDHGAALIWAHLIAFDLFVGRWIYLEARRLAMPAWLVGPVLVLTILLSPIGLLAFLALRSVVAAREVPASAGRGHGAQVC